MFNLNSVLDLWCKVCGELWGDFWHLVLWCMIKTKNSKIIKWKEKASKPNKHCPHIPHTHSALLWPSKGRTSHCHVVDGGGSGGAGVCILISTFLQKKNYISSTSINVFYSALCESKVMKRTESVASLVANCVVLKTETYYYMKTGHLELLNIQLYR